MSKYLIKIHQMHFKSENEDCKVCIKNVVCRVIIYKIYTVMDKKTLFFQCSELETNLTKDSYKHFEIL